MALKFCASRMHLMFPAFWIHCKSKYPTRSILKRSLIGHATFSFQNGLQGLYQLDHSQLADLLEQTLNIALKSNFFISWKIMKKLKWLTAIFQAICFICKEHTFSEIYFWLLAFSKLYEKPNNSSSCISNNLFSFLRNLADSFWV